MSRGSEYEERRLKMFDPFFIYLIHHFISIFLSFPANFEIGPLMMIPWEYTHVHIIACSLARFLFLNFFWVKISFVSNIYYSLHFSL